MSCVQSYCDYNAAICKRHELVNKEKHRTYKAALRWKEQFAKGQGQNEQTELVYLINVQEENKADCTNLVDEMGSVRKGIPLRYSPGAH